MANKEKSDEPRTCLTCTRPGIRRGLCHRCYQCCSAQVRAGRLTWDDAEALGLANPARTPGPWNDQFRKLAPSKASKPPQPRPPKDLAKPAEPGAGA